MALLAVVFLFSVIIHEVAHGYVALLNGDPTARMLGRITLNPIPHIDPIGSVLLPALLLLFSGSRFLIGWAKPVPVNPRNFRNYRWGEITVSAAGPLSNLALAVIFAFLLHLGLGNIGLLKLAYYGVSINIIPGPVQPDSHPAPGRLPHPGHPAAPEPGPALSPTWTGGLHPDPDPLLHRGAWALLMPLYRAIAVFLIG